MPLVFLKNSLCTDLSKCLKIILIGKCKSNINCGISNTYRFNYFILDFN